MSTTLVDESFLTYPINATNYPAWGDINSFGYK